MPFPRGTDPNDADATAAATVITRTPVPQATSTLRTESVGSGADANSGEPRIISRDEVPQAIAQR